MSKYIDYRLVQNDVLNDDFTARGRIPVKIKLGVLSEDVETLSGCMADRCIIVVIYNKLDSFIIVRNYFVSRENNPHLPKNPKTFTPRYYSAATAIVTIKNRFNSVEELLDAVSVQKDFKFDYSIGKITVIRYFLFEDYDYKNFKYFVDSYVQNSEKKKTWSSCHKNCLLFKS